MLSELLSNCWQVLQLLLKTSVTEFIKSIINKISKFKMKTLQMFTLKNELLLIF